MKRLFGSATLLMMLAGTAHSAEMPVKAPIYKAPPPPFAASWAGFYVGGNFGYSVGRARTDDDEDVTNATLSPAGAIGGGQAGYRFQQGWLVLGAEADLQWSGQRDRSLCVAQVCIPLSVSRNNRLEWFDTVRAVAGITHNDWLWYVTGGYAYGRIEDQAAGFVLGNGQVSGGSARVTKSGWAMGAGVETRLAASNWSVRLEYLYLNLGHLTYRPPCAGQFTAQGTFFVCDPPPTNLGASVSTSVQEHIIRIGLNYNIGGFSQPAVARAASPTMHAVSWGGFYVGGNFGYGVGHDRLRVERILQGGNPGTVFSLPQSPAGIVGGGQVGYRIQRDRLVFGAEADVQWSRQKDSSCVFCPSDSLNSYDEKLNWFGTLRGVAGIAQGDWLWYSTAGFAYGRVSVNYTLGQGGIPPALAASRSTQGGWTAGVGVETKLWANNWSARIEYLYMDLGKVSFDGYCSAATAGPFALQPGRCETLTNSVTNHVVRVGVNYKFGS